MQHNRTDTSLSLQDLVSMINSGNPSAFTLTGEAPDYIIDIHLPELKKADAKLIEEIIKHFIHHHDSTLTVRIGQPDVSYKISRPVVLMNANLFNKPDLCFEDFAELIENRSIIVNSILFNGVLTALHASNVSMETSKWAHELQQDMIAEYPEDSNYLSGHFTRDVLVLYRISQDQLLLADNLRYLIKNILKAGGGLSVLMTELDRKVLQQAIQEADGKPVSFLHLSLKERYEMLRSTDNIDILLDLMENNPTNLYDEDGCSLLHLCQDKKYFDKFLRLLPDINYQDKDGNTALHLAARDGNIDKVRFLMMNGADQNILNQHGQTFLTIPCHAKFSSTHYYQMYKEQMRKEKGKVLLLPPDIVKQRGQNCAFYAAVCSAQHHRDSLPKLFSESPMPARKGDTDPPASISLREHGKVLKISAIGEVFSASELTLLIALTGCKSIIIDIDINNYDQFISTIQKAIEKNLPVIIPFCTAGTNNGDPSKTFNAETAHWATIIGYMNNDKGCRLLTAQYGRYFSSDATDYFNAFDKISPTFPKRYLVKDKRTNRGWEIFKVAPDEDENVKVKEIPETELNEFSHKLVIVFPPNYDLELWNQSSNITLSKK